MSLSDVLVNVNNDVIARSAAGLQLKNALTAKDAEIRQEYQRRWLTLPENVRMHVKNNVISTLGTEAGRPSTAAQCVAYIAVTEIPKNLWPDVISILTSNVTNPASTELIKESNLEAIGYVCQDIDPDILVSSSNQILTAIVHGMRREEPSNHVRLAATTALLNSLEFTRANFEKDVERHFIMQVICEATQSEDLKVKVAALQCLVKIMSLYYVYMEHYMAPALFAITVQAMKSDVDEVALQGIEFWSNVCDEECELKDELEEANEHGVPPARTSRYYARGALQYLVPILTETLTKQGEGDDEDDWNPPKAAGVCLMLLATCVEDAIIPHIMPFVSANLNSPDWRRRDAAVMAFGGILEGPDPNALRPYVDEVLPTLISFMADKSTAVRDTTAWAIGKVCEVLPESVLTQDFLQPLLQVLVQGLSAEPRVASNVCWAFNSIAESAYEQSPDRGDSGEPTTYILSAYFEGIVQKLLETTERPDGNVNNLRASAYEALMELMKNSPLDCYATVQKTTLVILSRLQQVLQLEGQIASSDCAQYNDLASLLCATLQSVLRKVTPQDAPQISDAVMHALVSMLNSSAAGKAASGVQEDALMAVGAVVEVLGEGFMKYMDPFHPYLIAALRNQADYQVLSSAVGLVSDIARSLANRILPYCDEIMTLLLENLSNNNVHRSVKPQILSVFGDIALAIGPEFKKYLEIVLATLMQASQLPMDRSDYDMIDYINELRENCLDAYTTIVQGLKGDGNEPSPDVMLLQPHLSYIASFIITVASETESTDAIIGSMAGLVGDLLSSFGPIMIPLIDNEAVGQRLAKGKKSKVKKTQTLCNWAIKETKRLKAQLAQQQQQ